MDTASDVVCFSHLRWGYAYRRPNHLMARWARERRVFFVEEPTIIDGPPRIEVAAVQPNLLVCTPCLPPQLSAQERDEKARELLSRLLWARQVRRPLLWFCSPAALPLAQGVEASAVVYDCMDTSLASHQPSPTQLAAERALLTRADVVFTEGQSLYEIKRSLHPRVYAFPSSVDVEHFARGGPDPDDQRAIPHPRLGYFGVLDERLDWALVAQLAAERPGYHLVFVGPVRGLDPAALPQNPNIHYLGPRDYSTLPAYLANWEVALVPFTRGELTRHLSPARALEYLAGNKPVVSTPVPDMVSPYGELGFVRIAPARTFAEAVDAELHNDPQDHKEACAPVLDRTSWERTFRAMRALIQQGRTGAPPASTTGSPPRSHPPAIPPSRASFISGSG